MTSQNFKALQPEPSGASFDRVDVKRIKARLDPLGETTTYIEHLEAIAKAAYAYWNMIEEDYEASFKESVDLKAALRQVHWIEDLP